VARRQNNYPDETKAAVLAFIDVTDSTIKGAAETFGIPERTVNEWFNGRNVNEGVAKTREIKTAELIAALDQRIEQMVQALTPEKMADATVSQLTTGIGTLIDKTRLIRGESTEITEHREVDHLRDSIQRKLLSGTTSNGAAAQA
jgi:transposase-like protein